MKNITFNVFVWLWDSIWTPSVLCLLTLRLHLIDCDPESQSLFLVSLLSLYIYTYAYTCFIIYFLVLTKPIPVWIPVKASFSTSDTIVTLYRYRSTNRCVSLAKTTQKKFCGNPRVSLANSCTFLQQSTPPLTPPFIVMASPLPYSRMIFEATCGTISGLGSIKLISELSTLASPHTTQSTSSEDS